ncbi:MAG TPA: energy transducer TonB [Caldithrix abyssi]|uniref:Energy transducer TonB n=1 Tax=Caldithrix abyssi TaxID=187145 RepID=A0A7V5PQL3_CALAY|nr:energy transducer TonB [Caldithrix abyssi]
MKALVKKPEADLRLKYRKALEVGMIASLLIMIIMFYSFKTFESSVKLPERPDITIETIEIPQTQQLQKPPPPSRPSIPVETDDEDISDEVTIEETEVTLEPMNELPPPPPPEDEEVFEFFAVSEKPVIIHKEKPVYPDLARKAGIEGTVVVTVTIGKTGKVEDAKILKSIPMLDAAALAAARKCTFKPAKQRDKFVRVKMNIPFKFKLK